MMTGQANHYAIVGWKALGAAHEALYEARTLLGPAAAPNMRRLRVALAAAQTAVDVACYTTNVGTAHSACTGVRYRLARGSRLIAGVTMKQ